MTFAQSTHLRGANGTLLPAAPSKTALFGFSNGFTAPGLPFIVGRQYRARPLLTSPPTAATRAVPEHRALITCSPKNLDPHRLGAHPRFNIQVDAGSRGPQPVQVWLPPQVVNDSTLVPTTERDNKGPVFVGSQPAGSGSFQTSTITTSRRCFMTRANGETSKAFEQFVKNRPIVRDAKLAGLHRRTARAAFGCGHNPQDVLIQSFTDAYHGRSSGGYEAKKFNPFRMLPLPNWRVDYNGFADLPPVTLLVVHAQPRLRLYLQHGSY
jgi:cell surface protein SprA